MSEKDEIARLRSIMAAAADEIQEHWDAHCDGDGFGPVNLLRRLRTGKGDYRKKPSKSDDLAKRAVACKHWRWMPGMVATDGARLYRAQDDGTALDIGDTIVERGWGFGLANMFPDLTDPATLGCLLALVREAWEPHRGSDYIASTMHTGSGWGVGARYGSEGLAAIVLPTYASEAAALVAALEAAP